ncbi:metallophosphoesterase [Brenneria goodwinii]|uniref:metallophosphoesterase n=1 Tax=Brenneria goodwinii TaxID=1109412 RepID=UPI0036F116D8
MKFSRQLHTVLRVCGVVALLGSGAAHAEKFTVAVISDTQNYTDVTLPQPRGVNTFVQQMQYLVDTRKEKNLVFATHVGDVVQHGDGRFRTGMVGQYTLWDTRTEWDYANLALSVLSDAGIPFSVVPGNHDYGNYSWYKSHGGPGANRPLAGGSVWNMYFGPGSHFFADKTWYGGAYNNGMNSYQIFNAGSAQVLHLALEMEPTSEDLAWAQRVLDTHPTLPVIVTTHEWLDPNFTGETTRSNDYDAYFSGTDHLPPDSVWDTFIRKNKQIFLLLSGHDWTPTVTGVSQGQNLRTDNNDAGYPVYQLVQDYQGNTIGADGKPGSANGGAGWLRFIEFDTTTRKMHFYTYSTLLDKYAGRNGESTFGVAPGYSDFTLDFPPQLSTVQ